MHVCVYIYNEMQIGTSKYVVVPGDIVEGARMEGAEVAPEVEAGRAEWIKIDQAFNASAVSVC